jgi:hypothetical protein
MCKSLTSRLSRGKWPRAGLCALVAHLLFILAPAGAYGQDSITVHPSPGDPAAKADADWAALNEAFNNYEHVVLGAGEFYLPKTIVVWDPDLHVTGAGAGETVVRTAPGQDFEVVHAGVGAFPARAMLAFPYHADHEGTLEVRDITLLIDEPAQPYAAYQWWLDAMATLTTMDGIMVLNGGFDYAGPYWEQPPVQLDVTLENLDIVGVRDADRFFGYWYGFDFAQPNSVGWGVIVWGPNAGQVTARGVRTSWTSGGVMMSVSPVAVVDACMFEHTAQYYGALYLEDVPAATVTGNVMDGQIFATLVSGTLIDNTIAGGSGRFGAIYLNGTSDTVVADNYISDFVLRDQTFRSALYLWNSHYNDVVYNVLDDVLADGVGTAVVRVRGGSKGNDLRFNDLSASGAPGFASGIGGYLLDQQTTQNYVDLLEPRSPLPPGDPCDQVSDGAASNVIPGYQICLSGGAARPPSDAVDHVTDNMDERFGLHGQRH